MADCIFCKIVAGEIPAKIVVESENWLVFEDVNPQAPVHALLIPRKHIPSLAEADDAALMGDLLLGVRDAAKKLGLNEGGYRVINNIGEHGGQTVFHIHFHIMGKRHMAWPPG